MTPKMIVVAGAPGSGKSTLFPVQSFGIDAFNVDDRCRQLHGSYQGIPPEIRRIASAECESFIRNHIERHISFAVETTLRTSIAIEQARAARANRFTTILFSSARTILPSMFSALWQEVMVVVTQPRKTKYGQHMRRVWRTYPKHCIRLISSSASTRQFMIPAPVTS